MRIAILGYGRMGKEIEKIAQNRNHEIVLKVNEDNIKDLNVENIQKADVAIEFSTPNNAVNNIYACFDARVPVVVGTTGWLEKLTEVTTKCNEKNGGLFHASNFSLGVNIFFYINQQLAKIMNAYPEYEVSMEEIHHIHKLDSPSGTGITMANYLIENLDRKKSWVEGTSGDHSQIAIECKREDEVPGTHIVRYKSVIDDMEVKHVAHNRQGFALGAVLAAEFMHNKQGVYGMRDLMSF